MIAVFVSNYLIVGSGLSAFICFLKKTNAKILADISDKEVAKIEHELMIALGYKKYVVQGGDWGAPISK